MNYNDVKTPEELYDFMKNNIKYGFLSTFDNKVHRRVDMNDDLLYEKLLFYTYYLQTPDEVLTTKHGICYDQVELERDWFIKNGYEIHTYYTTHHNHTFLIYKDDDTYKIFERSIKKYNGIHSAESLEDAIDLYKRMQLEDADLDDIKLYEYDKVEFGCNIREFIDNVTGPDKEGEKLILRFEKLNM